MNLNRVPQNKVVQYLKNILETRELRNPYLYITCPHCKNAGQVDNYICPVCIGDRFINPKTFIDEREGGENKNDYGGGYCQT